MGKFVEKLFCEEITRDLSALIELISKVDKTEAVALFTNDKNDWRDHNALRKMLSQEAKIMREKYNFKDFWEALPEEKKGS